MTVLNRHHLVLPLLMSLCACSDNDKPSEDWVLSEQYQGVWLAPAYGMGATINNDTLTLFQYSTSFCFEDEKNVYSNDAELEKMVMLEDGNLHYYSGYGTQSFHAPALVLNAEDKLPNACRVSIASRSAATDDTDWSEDMAYFNEVMAMHSVSPEAMQLNWDALYADDGATITSASDQDELVTAMVNMITPLADAHTAVYHGDNEYHVLGKPILIHDVIDYVITDLGLEQPLSDEQEALVMPQVEAVYAAVLNAPYNYAEQVDDIHIAANTHVSWFVNDNLAYLRIDAMYGFADDASDEPAEELAALELLLDQVLADISETDGLILDVRTNVGGADYISLAIASRFSDIRRHAYSKQAKLGDSRSALTPVYVSPRGEQQYTKPIVLLVSPSTVSAGEVFSMSMSELPHVTLMGQPTQGALSDISEKQTGHGIVFEFSNEYYLSAQGHWYEGKGIPVDVEQRPFNVEEFEQGRDFAVEAAAAYLQSL